MYPPPLKLTFSHLKMDGWNNSFLLGWPIFAGELLVSGDVFFFLGGKADFVWRCPLVLFFFVVVVAWQFDDSYFIYAPGN